MNPFPTEHVGDSDVRVLLLENIHADGAAFLRGKGYQVETVDRALAEDELIEAIQGVQLLGIRSTTYITEKVLASAPDLLAIGAFCIGTNQIDLPATTGQGVAVFNAPYSNTRSVVELAIAEIISLARRLHEKSTDMHAGIWNKSAAGSHEVRGRTLGIVGYGNIGSQLSVIAEALGFKVIFYDIDDKLALGNARRCSTMEELLTDADVVSLHVDGRPGNAGSVRRRADEPDEAALAVPQPLPRHRRRPGGAPRAHRVRPHRRCRRRRVPGRAQAAGRPVRERAARAQERHPHAARRRFDRGGAAGHRPVRRLEAACVRRRSAAPR